MPASTLVLSLFLLPAPQSGEPPAPPWAVLDEEAVPAFAGVIEPDPAELAFLDIPWLPTFAEGVLAADRQQKPLLFWAMNGHPLGCT